MAFLRFLFSTKGLAPATLSSYRSALAKPLLLVFGIDVSRHPFVDLIRAYFNIKPSVPSRKFSWSLDKVLGFILSKSLFNSSLVADSLMCSAFLLALASGRRISELNSFLRGENFFFFFLLFWKTDLFYIPIQTL